MTLLTNTIITIIAIQHIAFLVLEMFYWDKALGRRVFGHSKEIAKVSKTLAANQGLYNGFLAAGLFWGLTLGADGMNVTTFFLACVLIAGIFGGMTASHKILYIQALPALIGLILIFLL
jgi:putative membrane protein